MPKVEAAIPAANVPWRAWDPGFAGVMVTPAATVPPTPTHHELADRSSETGGNRPDLVSAPSSSPQRAGAECQCRPQVQHRNAKLNHRLRFLSDGRENTAPSWHLVCFSPPSISRAVC